MNRASFGRSTGSGRGGPVFRPDEGVGATGLKDVVGTFGSGLLDGELSSLLGGVLNGDTRASKDGLRASGFNALEEAGGPMGTAIMFGFAGTFGLSARFTGGGLAGDFDKGISPTFCSLLPAFEMS